jgi:hypothetical protein
MISKNSKKIQKKEKTRMKIIMEKGIKHMNYIIKKMKVKKVIVTVMKVETILQNLKKLKIKLI